MTIRICTDKDSWELWQQAHGGEFLQSWDWGEFQRSVGREPARWQAGENYVQGFVHHLPLGMKYLYVPRCRMPARQSPGGSRRLAGGQNAECKIFLDGVKDYGYTFVRIEPIEQVDFSFGIWHLAFTRNRQPQHTLILDLTKSPEQLLAEMHPKTRYNIHLAERKGVTVRVEKNLDVFWQLNQQTIHRDKFRSHDKRYYEKMLRLDTVWQLTAYLGEIPIGTHILVVYGKRATYLHGASANEQRELMAPYLLQWAGIKMAMDEGCGEYDLWGVAPLRSSSCAGQAPSTCFHNYCWEATHPWTGVTRFKAGFGGMPKSYPSAQDVIFHPSLYRLYALARAVRARL